MIFTLLATEVSLARFKLICIDFPVLLIFVFVVGSFIVKSGVVYSIIRIFLLVLAGWFMAAICFGFLRIFVLG